MDEKILELLKESGAAGWEVTDTVKEGWEFYFIRHELDQNRIVDTEHVTVCVYESIGEGKELGSARMEIPAGSGEDEIRKMIGQLRKEAAMVKNPFYELNHPGPAASRMDQAPDPAEIAEKYIRTMTELPETGTEDINSYEIFTSCMKRRF
ncbi:MAG: TldD/PmbA family protein, partial [Bulleidia sp.]